MNTPKLRQQNNLSVTLYLPIFRERLEKLNARGKSNSDEAIQLRRSIEVADRCTNDKEIDQERPFVGLVAD
ncbi:MAG: hypothetical protein CMI60_19280 [Parvibaculum sp.]|jgi:hypothetical protein|nr:hypothetical protein [Parvibaculum sp.]|tara:strand:- start:1007 stop:1219 length:213 start_codon:yes stop_codon:yes gene_type:complete